MGNAERTAATLLDAYRPADDTEAADVARLVELIKAEDDPWSRALPLHLTSSALVVHPQTQRVLLRWHQKMGSWLQIGGHGDPGESDPFDVVLREGREETNLADLRPWPVAELTHVVVVPVPESPKEPAHDHADLRFVLATDTPDEARPEKPTAPLRWLTVPEALDLVAEDNLRDTLSRVARLF
ncbi:NUDIX domain-containing protein [Lentzea sp. NPDC051208]|uniref:NUDIX hydrolase n=1 Tax=Lentzea sp. NPDC051208 TaxID=3154642 RepID=UPI003434478D